MNEKTAWLISYLFLIRRIVGDDLSILKYGFQHILDAQLTLTVSLWFRKLVTYRVKNYGNVSPPLADTVLRRRFGAQTSLRQNCSLIATQNALKSRSLICVKCSRRLPMPRPTPRFLYISLFFRLHFCLPSFVRRVRRLHHAFMHIKIKFVSAYVGTTHLRFSVARLFVPSN